MEQDDYIHHIAADAAVVESGQPIVAHGEAQLRNLRFLCDGKIDGQIWGAGAALGRHLLARDTTHGKMLEDERPSVVEIGSGVGIAGLAAAAAGASRVVLTDLQSVVERLDHSIALNRSATVGCEVLAMKLPWGDEDAAQRVAEDGCDLVLAADVLYSAEPSVHTALRDSMITLARPRDALILHVYEERWPDIIRQWRDGLLLDPAEGPAQADGHGSGTCSDGRAARSGGSGLRLVREGVLEAPPEIRDGRRLVIEELRCTDEALYS